MDEGQLLAAVASYGFTRVPQHNLTSKVQPLVHTRVLRTMVRTGVCIAIQQLQRGLALKVLHHLMVGAPFLVGQALLI